MRRLGSNDPRGLVSCTRYGDVDEVSEALAPAGVEPVVRVPQAGAHILSAGLVCRRVARPVARRGLATRAVGWDEWEGRHRPVYQHIPAPDSRHKLHREANHVRKCRNTRTRQDCRVLTALNRPSHACSGYGQQALGWGRREEGLKAKKSIYT